MTTEREVAPKPKPLLRSYLDHQRGMRTGEALNVRAKLFQHFTHAHMAARALAVIVAEQDGPPEVVEWLQRASNRLREVGNSRAVPRQPALPMTNPQTAAIARGHHA